MTDKFMTFKKEDLQQAARLLHVNFDKDATKAEIASAIYDAGLNEDDYWNRLGVDEDYSAEFADVPSEENSDTVEEPVDVEESTEEPADEEAGEEDDPDAVAYGRFTGKNLRYVCSFGRFSRQRPVFQTTEAKLQEMIAARPNVFRRATPSEESLA